MTTVLTGPRIELLEDVVTAVEGERDKPLNMARFAGCAIGSYIRAFPDRGLELRIPDPLPGGETPTHRVVFDQEGRKGTEALEHHFGIGIEDATHLFYLTCPTRAQMAARIRAYIANARKARR